MTSVATQAANNVGLRRAGEPLIQAEKPFKRKDGERFDS
ncbi:hypothetical protein P3T40_004204 [Paraburkholderia sp. EB58]|jgi:hypothetical protein